MKEEIKALLSDALPMVDFESEFLFEQLDSIGVVTILTVLGNQYSIPLNMQDATPKNLMSLDALVRMVESKLQ
jgi:acyl carrier protein